MSANAALAQVTVPLPTNPPRGEPAAPPSDPSDPPSIYLPGDEPGISEINGPQLPQVPIGPHGRPDINPYDRDIDMTVPLTFQNRSLGEIPLRLTADDRFLLDTTTFLRLIRAILNDEAHAVLADQLAELSTLSGANLEGTGVRLRYDPSSLAVVVVEVLPEQRAIQNLFAPPRDDLEAIDFEPARFSGYLNLNAAQTYIWELGNIDPPTLLFDGAIRLGSIVFEGDAQLQQDFSRNQERYQLERNYARLVYDQPEGFRRWFLGDLDPEIRGQQAFVQLGGIGVSRQKRRFNAFRIGALQADRQLVLQRQSTVRFLRNGVLYRELRLQAGRYDFSSLPLIVGSNDVQIEVSDDAGRVQNLSYQAYLDPIDLEPGDYEYGAYLGATSAEFGSAPDYQGPIAFTGFYRKAFYNAPALGIGLQASEDVQALSGQTQFVFGGGRRLLVDGAISNSSFNGQGFSGGVALDQFFDRAGLTDSLSLRADYISPRFASIANPDAFNVTEYSLTAQYSRQFSQRLIVSLLGSYVRGRVSLARESYRVAANLNYRINRRWTIRGGMDYARLPGGRFGDGFSVNVGLVFQPDFRRRAEARYETRNNFAELSYTQSGLNELSSVGFGGVLSRRDDQVLVQGYGSYSHNRFDIGVSHASFGPDFENFTAVNSTSVRVGTTVAFADGVVGVGRRINDSFFLLHPHPNLKGRSVVAGQSLAQNAYIGRSGALGAALNNFLGSYAVQTVQYDVDDLPTGYDIGTGTFRVRPSYRSGYAARIGTDAFVSATGTLLLANGDPVSLIGGRVSLLDVTEGENPQPVPFFTNSIGRFAISSLLPGRRYLVETYGPNGTIDRSFDFIVPADTDGLVNLGMVRRGTAN